jgi:preprotein translocase subunit SecA
VQGISETDPEGLKSQIIEMIDQEIGRVFDSFAPGDEPENWDIDSLVGEMKNIMPTPTAWTPKFFENMVGEEALEAVLNHAHAEYEKKESELGSDRMRMLEQLVLLRVIDRLWVYHLTALEELRQGIGLVGYGQLDPLVEFKREAFDMFAQLNEHIRQNTVRQIYHTTFTAPAPPRPVIPANAKETGPGEAQAAGSPSASAANGQANGNSKKARQKARAQVEASGSAEAATPAAAGGVTTAAPIGGRIIAGRAGRNDPCPCGSGKKYKKCHGAGGLAGV